MKQLSILSLFLLLFVGTTSAQGATEANENFSKGVDGSAVIITCEGQKKNVEDLLDKKFKKMKGKGNTKGWTSYKGQTIDEFSPKTLEYYYRVDKASENNVKIAFMASYGNNNFLGSAEDATMIGNMKTFLDNLVGEIRRYELELAIEAQEKVYDKALKEQEKLEKDLEKLLKEKEKLEEDLAKNAEDQVTNGAEQETSKATIETEKKVLDELQVKLGSAN